MNAFVESAAVFLLGLAGALVGWRFSKLRSGWWLLGFAIPLVLVLMIGATRREARLEFVPPFSWLVAGRREFVLMAPITTMLLFTPLMRLKRRRTRVFVAVFAIAMMIHASVLAFLSPARARGTPAPPDADRRRGYLPAADGLHLRPGRRGHGAQKARC
ncbi:MAG: hypothetical protein QM813_06165 [Verrucomicrobiota bacterium]